MRGIDQHKETQESWFGEDNEFIGPSELKALVRIQIQETLGQRWVLRGGAKSAERRRCCNSWEWIGKRAEARVPVWS